ncbi:MAG TPA: hypothetical protein VI248_23320 [Kineosporiaceae bacterium]
MVSAAAFTRRAAASTLIAGAAAGVLVTVRRAGPPPAGGQPRGTSGSATRRSSPAGAGSPTPAEAPPSVVAPPSAGAAAGTRPAHGGPPDPPSATPGLAQLPRGGRVVFPGYRLVGFSGGPGSAAFGRLGVGSLDRRVLEIEQLARRYAADRDPQPVLELIAVVAQPWPGQDGRYRVRIGADVIDDYLAAARRHRALLLLNVQPGRARFLDEVKALGRWLSEPEVGLALDPEWAVRLGQVPGRVFGRTTGAEIDAVAGYLESVVSAGALPEKVLVVHQLRPDIVQDFATLRPHPGVVVVRSVDGIGPPREKINTWTRILADRVAGIHPGFKLFFEEDSAHGSRLMTPAEVLGLRPVPEYILYE